ncbi:TonB-dependent receptor [Sphingomonas sp. RS6]
MIERLGWTALLLSAASPALAQQATPDAIVVTGYGLDAPPGEIAYDRVTIDQARLADTASGRLEDALADVAGLAQFRRSDSNSAHPTSQGITLRGLGGNAASRAILLLDGVPQADPFGGWVAFPAYMPGRLAAATVTRGGGSGYAGPGALAGSIALDSAGPATLDPLQLAIAAGSRDSLDASALGAAPLGNGFVTVAGNYRRSDGFTPIVARDRGSVDRPAPYEQASLALRGVTQIGDGAELQANLSGFTDRRDRGVDFTDLHSQGTDASVRLVRHGDRDAGLWGWSALAYLQARRFESGFASVDADRATAAPVLRQVIPSTGIGGRLELAPPTGAVDLRLGGDVRSVSGRTQEAYLFSDGAATRRRIAGGDSVTLGGFVDASHAAGALTIDAGGRIDYWRIGRGKLQERTLAGGPALRDDRFAPRQGWEGTGRIGLAYRLRGVTLRMAGYRGWRLPTLNELYRPYRVGADATAANAALDPERLWGGEVGADWRPVPSVELRATAYWNQLDGAIANVTLAQGPGNFLGVGFVSAAGAYRMRQNLDAVEARGLELDGRWTHGPFSLAASWAYADSRVHASGAAAQLDGLRPAQTPEHQASATLAWRRGDAGASLTARYAGARFEDDQNQASLDPAWTVDATLAVPLMRQLRAEFRAENLFDTEVQAGISGDDLIERATPRTLWIGLRYRLR